MLTVSKLLASFSAAMSRGDLSVGGFCSCRWRLGNVSAFIGSCPAAQDTKFIYAFR